MRRIQWCDPADAPSREALEAFEYLGRFIEENPNARKLTPQDLIAALTLYDALGGEPTEQRVSNSVHVSQLDAEITFRLTLNNREWSYRFLLDDPHTHHHRYRQLPPLKDFR